MGKNASYIIEERNNLIKELFYKYLKEAPKHLNAINYAIDKIYQYSPDKYYTSFETARRIISNIHNDKYNESRNMLKRVMYFEIYHKWLENAKLNNLINNPYKYKNLNNILNSKASSFFLDKTTIHVIIYKK